MKTDKILYWVFTIIFAVFMAWSGVSGVKPNADAITFMHDGLGFPVYFIQFISIAKILGAIALLIPGLRTIKEWAYAGMFFDLIGAFYSVNANAGKFEPTSLFILFTLLIGAASYYFWKKTS
jgi:uncharacterized membrane protein YphA (DoxX/SURF4 family)